MRRDKAYYEALHREFYHNRKRKPHKGRRVNPDRNAEGYWLYQGGTLRRSNKAQEWNRWRRWCALVKRVQSESAEIGHYRMRWGYLSDDIDGKSSRRLRLVFKTAQVSMVGWALVRVRGNPINSAAVTLGYVQYRPTECSQTAVFRLTDKGRRLIHMLE